MLSDLLGARWGFICVDGRIGQHLVASRLQLDGARRKLWGRITGATNPYSCLLAHGDWIRLVKIATSERAEP